MLNVYLFRFSRVFHANLRLNTRVYDMQPCKMSASTHTHTPRNVRSLTPTSRVAERVGERGKQAKETKLEKVRYGIDV